MHIAHVISHLQTGGAEKLVAEIANAISVKGIKVKVISLFEGRGIPYELLDKQKVELIELNYKSKLNPKIAIDLFKLTQECDVVHTHTYYAQLYSSMLISTKKLITTEHSTSNNRRGKPFFKLLDSIMYAKYKKIICISKGTQDNLIKWIPQTKTKSFVISNGLNLNKFINASAISKKELNVPEEKKVLVSVGRLVKAKNHETLIKAMTKIDINANLILIGSGDKETGLKRLVKELNLNDRVQFLGERDDVEKILKASDIFILPSLWEGFGLAAVEALASGLPVILSEVEGLKEIADNTNMRITYFNPQDFLQLAEKVNLEISLLSEKNRKIIESQSNINIYKLDFMIEKYLENYDFVNIRGQL